MTEKQSRFVEFFLRGPPQDRLCATRAARAAGYAWPGKQGPRLMTVPEIAAAIEAGFLAMHPGVMAIGSPEMHVGKCR